MVKWKRILKQLFFIVAISIPLFSIFLFSKIITELEIEAKKQLKFQVEVFQSFLESDNSTDITFLFNRLIENTTYPVILTDTEFTPITSVNIDIENENNRDVEMQNYIQEFRAFTEPIPIKYEDQILGYYCYGEPTYLKQLKWLPVIVFSVIVMLIFVAYFGFISIKRSEEKSIWVGLAKETAHQLGTPISSISGWVELLKENPKSLNDSLPEFEKDIERLNVVLSRFSKIGSKAEFSSYDLNDVISEVVEYFKKRLPKYDKEISLKFERTNPLTVMINKELVIWVFENLTRNAIDALQSVQGKIEISLSQTKQIALISFKDNGSGISGKDHKKIFSPGYTTKRRGWGLGLSLAKRIIENYHNGRIYVFESAEGKGTTFNIEFKLSN